MYGRNRLQPVVPHELTDRSDQLPLQLLTRGRRVPYVYGMIRVPAQDQRT